MPVIALITWIITALGGLFLLAIWLIEYDPDFQRAAATRLPVPVVATHVLLAVGGLFIWVGYLLTDEDLFAWIAFADMAVVVTFGMTMALRWVGVYRAKADPGLTPIAVGISSTVANGANGLFTSAGPASAHGGSAELIVPPERHFPVSVVIGHGVCAFTTVVLVLLTVLGVGGS